MIRELELQDVPAITRIYNHYVRHTINTFEETVVREEEMAHRVSVVMRHCPWLVVEDDYGVQGFAYANFWKARPAYRHTLETTIYLDHGMLGRGLGRQLYANLLARLREKGGCHRLVACVSLPNAASVALHEHLGYRQIGHFTEVGRKFERWIDIGYWQLDLGSD